MGHGEVGDVQARCPTVMNGYFANRAATAEVMREGGWFATGDLGRWLPDGDQRLQDYVNQGLGGRRLEALQRRVVVVATRRDDKTPRFFTTGNAGVAVRASSAVPGIVSPVGIAGVEYEDGDESLPLAVSATRAAGARFIIAVNVYPRTESTPSDAPASMRERDARRRARIEPEITQADFVLHPDLGYYASPLRSYFVESRQIGEATARAQLPALLAKLKTIL